MHFNYEWCLTSINYLFCRSIITQWYISLIHLINGCEMWRSLNTYHVAGVSRRQVFVFFKIFSQCFNIDKSLKCRDYIRNPHDNYIIKVHTHIVGTHRYNYQTCHHVRGFGWREFCENKQTFEMKETLIAC